MNDRTKLSVIKLIRLKSFLHIEILHWLHADDISAISVLV